VAAQQTRRSKEAQLEADRVISDRQRELDQTRAANAALIAAAEAKKQDALALQRVAELDATQIAQARADAERVKIEALAAAEAEAIRITTVATAQAESIRKVNEAIREGGESYFRYRQVEMLPQIAPAIAGALAEAKLVTIAGDGGAPDATVHQIGSVIQTVLAAQLIGRAGLLDSAPAVVPAVPLTPPGARPADGAKRN
jgi:flotillin